MPRKSDIKNFYKDFNMELFDGKNGQQLFECLQEKCEEYNINNEKLGGKVRFETTTEKCDKGTDTVTVCIAIVTPLMRRVHQYIRNSGELMFMDSTSNLEEHNLRYFMIRTHSAARALLLAALVTSDEKEPTLTTALSLVKGCLPEDAIFGRGREKGPMIGIAEHNDEERKPLTHSWPETQLLLCLFYVLQAIWRWLYDKHHNIRKNTDRQ